MSRSLLPSLAAVTLAASACGTPAPPPASAAHAPAAAKPTAKADQAPSAAADAPPAFVYAYTPVGKRDPFRSPLEEAARTGADLSVGACNQPLCRWDLDQLHLVGIVTGMSNPIAMVEDPNGIGYVVRRGGFMGKKQGRVTAIKRDEVVVTEIYRDSGHTPHPNNIVIRLERTSESNPTDQNLLQSEVSE